MHRPAPARTGPHRPAPARTGPHRPATAAQPHFLRGSRHDREPLFNLNGA